MVWLCGWLAGEVFVLVVLIQGLIALVTGQPLPNSSRPLDLGPALAIGGFLLVWLALWTFGGWMAIRELLRRISAEDRILIQPGGLLLIRRLGPFVKTRHLPLADIRRIYIQPPHQNLVAQVAASPVTLTDLGTPDERQSAATKLQAIFPSAKPPDDEGALPAGWQEISELRGGVVITHGQAARRGRARALAVISGGVWAAVLLLAQESLHNPNRWVLTAMLGALALWLSRQTYRLFRIRDEWRIDRGRIVYQRRSGDEVQELAEAHALELTETTDSDRDRWYELTALVTDRPPQTDPRRIILSKTLHDPTEPRNLGRWLARRAAIPLHDRIPTAEDRSKEWHQQVKSLEQAGRLGRWLADQLKKRPPPP